MDVLLNLRGIISQRLVMGLNGKRVPAVEVLINTPYTSELIKNGKFGEMKETIEKGTVTGMQTFYQSLCDLVRTGKISLQDALASADSRSDLEWRINFGGGVQGLDKASDDLQLPNDILETTQGSSIDEARGPPEGVLNDGGGMDAPSRVRFS